MLSGIIAFLGRWRLPSTTVALAWLQLSRNRHLVFAAIPDRFAMKSAPAFVFRLLTVCYVKVMREQLRKWSLTGVWASMTPSNRRVYALLAGDAGPSSGWLSALSAAVWLSDRSVRPLAEMLHGVDGPYDVRLALLRVRSNRLLPPHAVLRNAPVAIDHAVQVHPMRMPLNVNRN